MGLRPRLISLHGARPGQLLETIASVGRDVVAYRARAGRWMAHVAFQWEGGLLSQAPPLLCNAGCGSELTLDCRPALAVDEDGQASEGGCTYEVLVV